MKKTEQTPTYGLGERRFLSENQRPCPYCGESIPTSRLTCPHCKGRVYRKLVEEDLAKPVTLQQGVPSSLEGLVEEAPRKPGGRSKKVAVDPWVIDFSGLEAAVEDGNGKLRKWRESRGLSQSDMALLLKMTKRHYQRIEETGKISSQIMGKILHLVEGGKKAWDL